MGWTPIMPTRVASAGAVALLVVSIIASPNASRAENPVQRASVFAQFELPDDWEARFWADPGVKALLTLDAKGLAELVPVQAGVRYCRCPKCDATEAENPLRWSPARPKVLPCRRCGDTVMGGDHATGQDDEECKDQKR